jgi:hypothetical protein
MFRHERSLVHRYAGAPFALLGVNSDESAGKLREVEHRAELGWPSIHDGRGGPVCAAWGIEAFPTLVLIDAQGAVRWRHVGVPAEGEVEARVEALLRETHPGR